METEPTTFAWGKNKENELAQGSTRNVLRPAPIKKKNLRMATSGGQHSAAIDSQGKLYVCGCSLHGKLGVDGLSTVILPRFTAVTELAQRVVRQVACGDYHTLCLLEDSSVYTWGGALHKKLGQRGGRLLNRPGEVSHLRGKHVAYVDCGDFHSVALTANGELYSWGGGGSFYNRGQCGHGHTRDVENPSPLTFFQGKFVTAVSCGGYHTLALTDNNELFAWGSGLYGECGFGEFINTATPRVVLMPWLKGDLEDRYGALIEVSAGGHHSLALTSKGSVFSFGYGSHGQLGLRVTSNQCEPQFVNDLTTKPVKTIAAGWNHSIVLMRSGDVFACGHGFFGQLGLGNEESKTVFTYVEFLGDKRVQRIYAGGNHSWALLDPAAPSRREHCPPSPIPLEVIGPQSSVVVKKRVGKRLEYVLQVAYSDVQFCHRFVRFRLEAASLDIGKTLAEEYVQGMYVNEQGLQYHRIQQDDDIVEKRHGEDVIVSRGGGDSFTCLLVCDPSKNEPPVPNSEFSDEPHTNIVILKSTELKSNPVQEALSEWVRFFLGKLEDCCVGSPKFFEMRPLPYYMPII